MSWSLSALILCVWWRNARAPFIRSINIVLEARAWKIFLQHKLPRGKVLCVSSLSEGRIWMEMGLWWMECHEALSVIILRGRINIKKTTWHFISMHREEVIKRIREGCFLSCMCRWCRKRHTGGRGAQEKYLGRSSQCRCSGWYHRALDPWIRLNTH